MLDESWNMISRMRTEHKRVDQKFAKVVEAFSHDRDVTIGGGKGFGSGALKVKGTIFAMMSSKNEFVVKLSKDRVDALVASGTGKRFEPRPGRFMKEWIVYLSMAWTGSHLLKKRGFAMPSRRGSPQNKCPASTPIAVITVEVNNPLGETNERLYIFVPRPRHERFT